MKNRIKIGILSEFNPEDRKASSGTNFKMAEQLGNLGEIQWIPIKKRFLGKCITHLFHILSKRGFPNINFPITRAGRILLYKKINQKSLDSCDIIAALFCVQNLGKICTSSPIIYFSDSTFPVLLNYYDAYSNIPACLQKEVLSIEKEGLEISRKAVFSSNWAKSGAIQLGINEAKLHIVEFGANINEKDIKVTPPNFYNQRNINLLFLGVDWKRKGGDIAVETVKWLNSNGIDATLHIVGINPPEEVKKGLKIVCHGFKNKNVKDEYEELVHIIQNCHLLLLPTIAECAGIAFAEASANGLPIFTHDTGGIPDYVINGVNGYRLPIGSNGEDFGKKIKETIDNGEISKLSDGGRELYKNRLNWERWGSEVKKIIDEVCANT